MGGRSRGVLIAALLALGCSHEVIRLGEDPPAVAPRLDHPIGLTVAVRAGSFDKARVKPEGIVELFARKIRKERLFQGVIHPIPPGTNPLWELELSGHDQAYEPGANFWKAALVAALPPLAFFVWSTNDYTLDLEALLLRRRELVRSYRTRVQIRHRYQRYADRAKMEIEGVESVVYAAADRLLAEIARDAEALERLNDTAP
ncbi:MAG: hypothetical protein ACE5FG_01625 [Myxococcota bacterium]